MVFASITDAHTGELSQLQIGDWIADSLLLDDLGYHDNHLYVTNLPRKWFKPREIAALYANRWSVETLVQEAKWAFGLDEISVRRKKAIECFVLASLLMVLLSRYLR